MRNALRLAWASPMPISTPRRRASSTDTISRRLFISCEPLFPSFGPGYPRLRGLRILPDLFADEAPELSRRAGLRFEAPLHERVFHLGRVGGLHDPGVDARDAVLARRPFCGSRPHRVTSFYNRRTGEQHTNGCALSSMKLSVLDQSTASKGRTEDHAIRETLDLARRCDALGYHRYWVSE